MAENGQLEVVLPFIAPEMLRFLIVFPVIVEAAVAPVPQWVEASEAAAITAGWVKWEVW